MIPESDVDSTGSLLEGISLDRDISATERITGFNTPLIVRYHDPQPPISQRDISRYLEILRADQEQNAKGIISQAKELQAKFNKNLEGLKQIKSHLQLRAISTEWRDMIDGDLLNNKIKEVLENHKHNSEQMTEFFKQIPAGIENNDDIKTLSEDIFEIFERINNEIDKSNEALNKIAENNQKRTEKIMKENIEAINNLERDILGAVFREIASSIRGKLGCSRRHPDPAIQNTNSSADTVFPIIMKKVLEFLNNVPAPDVIPNPTVRPEELERALNELNQPAQNQSNSPL